MFYLVRAGNWATDYKKEWVTGSFGSSRLTPFKLFHRCALTMTEEAADEATNSLEGFLEDLPGTRADLPAEVEVRRSFLFLGWQWQRAYNYTLGD